VVAEYTESTASTTPDYAKSYVYAGSRLLATYAPTSTTKEAKQYHHPDRLGTQLVTTGASTSYRQTTFPFGTTISAETTGNSNQIFTSYDRSTTTGLDYAQNRTYSQGQSRFTQVDPIGMASAMLGNPQSNNLFAYVMNMPTDFVDPSGLNAAGGYYTWTCYYTWASDWDGSNFRITSKTCWNTGYVDSTGGHGSGSSSPSVSASPDEFQFQKCMRAVEKKYKDLKKPDNYGEYSQVRDQLVQAVNKRNAALGSLTPVQVVLLAVSLRGGKVGVAIWAAGTVAAKIWESGVIHEEWMTGVGNLERTFPAGVEYDKQMGYKEAEQDECEKYLKRP
jgi:RHS repeat-associated protein